MKILYLSCHSILEYDELRLFEELDYPYFSLGSYVNPKMPVDPIRPALQGRHAPNRWQDKAPMRDKLTKEFVDDFDVVIVMHMPEWIEQNWEVMKHKKVIWRTIGQSTPATEARLKPYRDQGLLIVRYSPAEIDIPGNIGCDQVIRFYKDPDEFFMYNGVNRQLITLAQNMQVRAEHCNFEAFKSITDGFPAKLYGSSNEISGELSGGFQTYDNMKQLMRDNRAYIYTGTQPASYTLNFIEAFMTGIPMVCIGEQLGNSLHISGGNLYEIGNIIKNGENGYISDNIAELRGYAEELLNNPDLAQKVGKNGRYTAIELFGKDKIKAQWRAFLENL
jgi:glycosyltransferase involved in cell wall biosynthesis